jgi:TolB-like protein/tRNA A-37 threonylcarbamoyl transferase component Bud32/Tfp pilus assembly protein PilF
LKADHNALIDLAGSVADGTPVDWSDAETRADVASRRLVRHLRLVENIASLHKSMSDDQVVSDLAASVADGATVDWPAVESRADLTDRRLIRHLRLVESISTLHRTAALAGEAEDKDAAAPQAVDPEPAGPRWGLLVLLEQIGRGASSEVFRGWDSTLHQEVALKLLHDEGKSAGTHKRLLEEARRLARVHHRHVVHVYGADEHDGRVGLWMELVRGESLEQLVKLRGPFGDREAALIGLDLCAALAAVHGAGVLHRDVKAQNVMRENGGRIVLMDFGTGEELAGTNRLVGTPLYLAPEIFRGDKASVQTDLYSVGVLLFYLVSGQFPVTAASMEQLGRAHDRGDRRPIRDVRPDLPEGFVRVIERALDPDLSRRYRTAGAMEAALREAIAPLALPAAEPSAAVTTTAVTDASAASHGRAKLAFIAVAAVLVALVVGLIAWTRGPVATEPPVQSLAVLPFRVHPASADVEIGDAITEQFIATMAQVASIRTTSLASAMPFKQSNQPRTEIARQLGVGAVLEGTLTVIDDLKAGPGQLRLDVQLLAAGGGAPLWSGQVTRHRGESAALLAEVARAVSEALRAPITTAEAARLRQTRPTNAVAEEAYLQGRLHLTEYGQLAAQRALKSFLRATEADPGFAAAHASAAFAYVKLASFGGMSHAEAQASARREIRLARETGQDTAESHAAEGDLKLLYDWDWDGAEREYRRSIVLNPGFLQARNVYAQLLAARHKFDESLAVSEESLRIDAQSIQALTNHGMLLYYKHDFDKADAISQQALSLEPGSEAALGLRYRVLEALGHYDEALAVASEALRLSGNDNVPLRVVIIRLLALQGRVDESRRATQVLEAEAARDELRLRPRDRAFIALAQGRKQEALDQFERALDERDPTLMWLTVVPRVDSLRDEPRFQAILEKMRLN